MELRAILACFLLLAIPAGARGQNGPVLQSDPWYGAADVGVATVGPDLGLNLSGGMVGVWTRLVVAGRVDLVLVPTASERYYRDQFSNGQSRCRDSETGQFASDSKCAGLGVLTGFLFDANVRFTRDRPYFVGLGFRASNVDSTPFVSAGTFLGDPGGRTRTYLRGAVGRRFFELSFGVIGRI